MEAHRRLVVPAWTGFVLIVIGFLTFVGSYFLLPVVQIACFDSCDVPYTYATAWEMSMRSLSAPSSPGFLVGGTFALVLCFLPLLAAAIVVGCRIGFVVHPHHTFATWSCRAWLVGISVLGLAFPFLSFFILRPYIGYLGMLFGYGLLWAGNRLFLTPHP